MNVKEFILCCGKRHSFLTFRKKGDLILTEIKHGSGFNDQERKADAQAKVKQWSRENPYLTYKIEHDNEILVYQTAIETGWYRYKEFVNKFISEDIWEDATTLYCAEFLYDKTRCEIKSYPKSSIGTVHTITSDGYTGWGGGDRYSVETHHYEVVLNPDMTVTRKKVDTTNSVVGPKSFMGGWV